MGWKPIREVKIVDDLVYVPLTQGYTAIVDLCDLDIVKPYNWYAIEAPNVVYAIRSVRDEGVKKEVAMHRFILKANDSEVCDHINGNGIDNRRINLRSCTKSENGMNRGRSKNNKSGIKGVCWDKKSGKWMSQIKVKENNFKLGYYEDIIFAIAIRFLASKVYFGEFDRL